MATHLSGQLSPNNRRKSPSSSSSHTHASINKHASQPPRDRYRDRSLPPRRHSQYDSHENKKIGHETVNRQSNHTLSQRPAPKSTSPNLGTSNESNHRDRHPITDASKSQKLSDSNNSTDMTEHGNLKKQEEIFKLLLETITEVSSLKVENKRATVKLEASQERYDKSASHHLKFPNLRLIQQNELDKSRLSVDKINEELSRKDAIFKDLAGQSIPILLPAIQAGGYKVNQNPEDPKAFERLENVLSKTERQFTELQQEFKRFKEEQKFYQSDKEKQIADQESKLKAMITTDSEREKETAKLRSQLRILNDEVSNLQKERVAFQAEIGAINDLANNSVKEIGAMKDLANSIAKETDQMKSHLSETEEKSLEKFKSLETQFGSISSVKSSLKNLRENGLFDVKVTTLDDISTTLKVAMSRIDSLPSAASYFSLNSRLEILEKEKVADSLRGEISHPLTMKFENRLKNLEVKAESEPQLSPDMSSISDLEEKVATLTTLVASKPDTTKYDEDILNLRCTTAELQRSLNVVRINVAGLHERSQSNTISGLDETRLEKTIESKTRTFSNDTMRKINEVFQMLAATNHSLENLMARVDNITTGHLAQAMLNQLSETYPHIQNVEQLFLAQRKRIQELQEKVDQLCKAKVESPPNKNEVLVKKSPLITNSNSNNCRNLGKEVDKLTEDIFKISLTIKRLISASEDDRKFVSDKLDSQLNVLASKDDLNKHKLELENHIKILVKQRIEEHSRDVNLPEIDKTPKLLNLEAFLEDNADPEIGSNLAGKNAYAITKIEEGVASLREGLITRITKETQQQKKALEEFVIAQVDKCLASKRSDLVKEVARRVELKIAVDADKATSESALITTNSSSMAIPNTPIMSSPNLHNIEGQRNKRKLQEIKTESPRVTGFNSNGSFFSSKKSRFTSSGADDTT